MLFKEGVVHSTAAESAAEDTLVDVRAVPAEWDKILSGGIAELNAAAADEHLNKSAAQSIAEAKYLWHTFPEGVVLENAVNKFLFPLVHDKDIDLLTEGHIGERIAEDLSAVNESEVPFTAAVKTGALNALPRGIAPVDLPALGDNAVIIPLNVGDMLLRESPGSLVNNTRINNRSLLCKK